MTTTRDEINYALNKQVNTVNAVHTNYGVIDMDLELAEAVGNALRTVLMSRLKRLDEDTRHS